MGLDWHKWGETKVVEARRRLTDEPLLWDTRDIPLRSIFGTFIILTAEVDRETGVRLDVDELPYIITDRTSFYLGSVFSPPSVGHRITRINTDVIYEVVRRKDDREWRTHGTYELEMRVHLSPLEET